MPGYEMCCHCRVEVISTHLPRFLEQHTRGIRIAALIDTDPKRVGTEVGGITVEPLTALSKIVRNRHIAIAVIATPAEAAQDVTDALVAAGVTSILNFAPAIVTVPEGVDVRKVDLSIELQILAYHEQRKAANASDDGTAEVTA